MGHVVGQTMLLNSGDESNQGFLHHVFFVLVAYLATAGPVLAGVLLGAPFSDVEHFGLAEVTEHALRFGDS